MRKDNYKVINDNSEEINKIKSCSNYNMSSLAAFSHSQYKRTCKQLELDSVLSETVSEKIMRI